MGCVYVGEGINCPRKIYWYCPHTKKVKSPQTSPLPLPSTRQRSSERLPAHTAAHGSPKSPARFAGSGMILQPIDSSNSKTLKALQHDLSRQHNFECPRMRFEFVLACMSEHGLNRPRYSKLPPAGIPSAVEKRPPERSRSPPDLTPGWSSPPRYQVVSRLVYRLNATVMSYILVNVRFL